MNPRYRQRQPARHSQATGRRAHAARQTDPARSAAAPARAALERHVVQVQRTIRTCTGCGLCCTATYNTMQILPWEGARIAAHLQNLPASRRDTLVGRLRAAVRRWRLRRSDRDRAAGRLLHYTCAFLEPDMSCALPLDIKPVACLSFNPLSADSCDQEPHWFRRAGQEVEARNRAAGLPMQREPIPVAALAALDDADRT